MGLSAEQADAVVGSLLKQGRISAVGDGYRTDVVTIPVGESRGWEAAVFDHYQAMVTAIGKKVTAPRSSQGDVVGGATLAFDVYDQHPHRERVYGLLAEVRGQVNEQWNDVRQYHQEHPVPDEQKHRVSFYFGQSVTPPEDAT